MRVVRHGRVRKRVAGTAERPRLAVYRSLRHISAQLIVDDAGATICAVSTQDKSLKAGGNCDGAKLIGARLAKLATEKGITSVIFDRGGYRYHGCIASLAEGAREGGLEF
jgi:large subunit ribosomal protein L18